MEILKDLKIFTVEGMVDAPQRVVEQFGPGGHKLQARAKAYLQAALDGKYVNKLASENEDLKVKMGLLEETLEALKQQIKELDKPKGRKK